ncbi:MarR family transcriptional regulator [Aureimonas flava]|uniref:MarR family transcriptional regulator n=1 Tax=Aureimonas flava TaxID=2320271 RepID=A0A3A1WJ31_9HYPH|nr:MarR family winged helix-turn-helix transcriptional regulator [Aureimonas flava]RIX98493.1 MarR family transcriptional regulator [Aureimonas flava]
MDSRNAEAEEDVPDGAAPYEITEQVGYLLRRAYQRHLAIFQANSGDGQLTSVQFSTLCALRDHGPQSQSELVRATGVDQATIRGIVDRLKARALISLAKDPADARKVIIAASPAGLDMVAEMIPHARRITELTFGGLNPAERLALLHTLRRIVEVDDVG